MRNKAFKISTIFTLMTILGMSFGSSAFAGPMNPYEEYEQAGTVIEEEFEDLQ